MHTYAYTSSAVMTGANRSTRMRIRGHPSEPVNSTSLPSSFGSLRAYFRALSRRMLGRLGYIISFILFTPSKHADLHLARGPGTSLSSFGPTDLFIRDNYVVKRRSRYRRRSHVRDKCSSIAHHNLDRGELAMEDALFDYEDQRRLTRYKTQYMVDGHNSVPHTPDYVLHERIFPCYLTFLKPPKPIHPTTRLPHLPGH